VFVNANGRAGTIFLVLIDNDSIVDSQQITLGGNGVYNGNAMSTAAMVTPPAKQTQITTSARAPRTGSIDVGRNSAIALTTTDIPIISYYDATNGNLKLALCDTPACIYPAIRTLDSTGDVGAWSSIALSKTNIPYVAYYDTTNGDLKLAICKSTACTATTIITVDNATNNVGQFVGLKLTSTGIPIISYYDATNSALKVAFCGSTTCNKITLTTVPGLGSDSGYANALALTQYNSGQSTLVDLPRISYYDRTNNKIKVVVCGNQICSTATVADLDSTVSGVTNQNTSIDVSSENYPVVSYIDSAGKLKVATCTDTNCSITPTFLSLSGVGDVTQSSLMLTSADILMIASYDTVTQDLWLTECHTAYTCTSRISDYLHSTGNVGQFPALVLNSLDIPITAYTDVSNLRLKLAVPKSTVDDGSLPRFAKTAPSNNSTLTKPIAKLTWNAPVGASNHAYEYCIATSIAACTTWVNVGTATSVTVNVSPSTTYVWQVRVLNPANITVSSGGYWSFRTK